jgi:hypothetical protein
MGPCSDEMVLRQVPETNLEIAARPLGQNLKEILLAIFEPFSENKFAINVGMYNKGNRRFCWKLREIWKLGVGARVQI